MNSSRSIVLSVMLLTSLPIGVAVTASSATLVPESDSAVGPSLTSRTLMVKVPVTDFTPSEAFTVTQLRNGTLDMGRRPSGGFLVHARLPIGGT